MDDLTCTNCGEYLGSPIAARIEALEARIAKADALAEVLSRLRGREGPLTSWLDVQEALAAYREGSDT